jgi:DNA-binding protein
MDNTLPIAPVRKLLKEAGCKRISDEAVLTVVKVAENAISEIGQEASAIANHANRVTVRDDDILFVI